MAAEPYSFLPTDVCSSCPCRKSEPTKVFSHSYGGLTGCVFNFCEWSFGPAALGFSWARWGLSRMGYAPGSFAIGTSQYLILHPASPDLSLGLTYKTKSNYKERKRKKDLRLPLLLFGMTKEHYSMGHVLFRRNDFSTETSCGWGKTQGKTGKHSLRSREETENKVVNHSNLTG